MLYIPASVQSILDQYPVEIQSVFFFSYILLFSAYFTVIKMEKSEQQKLPKTRNLGYCIQLKKIIIKNKYIYKCIYIYLFYIEKNHNIYKLLHKTNLFKMFTYSLFS